MADSGNVLFSFPVHLYQKGFRLPEFHFICHLSAIHLLPFISYSFSLGFRPLAE